MRPAYVESIAVVGPGLAGWRESLGALREPATYRAGPLPSDEAVAFLSANERRRTTPVIRLALQVIDQLARYSSLDLSKVNSVFASALGDLRGLDGVCSALAAPGAPVSPLQFHNVVHNIPAGYWSRAAGATGASTSLSAGDATFAAGLIEAVTCLGAGDNGAVLLVCYDHPGPAALARHVPVSAPFAVAMMLLPEATNGDCCALQMAVIDRAPESDMKHPELETLRRGNAAARVLPLLTAIATGEGGRVLLPYVGHSTLAIEVTEARRRVFSFPLNRSKAMGDA
jgi:hypothetical protein